MARTRAIITGLVIAAFTLAALAGCDLEQFAQSVPPAAPSDLTATPLNQTRMQLSWTDNSGNEAKFEIQRHTGGAFETIGEMGVDSNGYVDTGLTAGTTYEYRVRATNTAGDSDWSASAQATTASLTTYAVLYWPNGADAGAVPVDSSTYEEGDSVTVCGAGTLTMDGSTFVGWNTEPDRGGTDYGPGSVFLMPASDVDLYAQWSANPAYDVTYHGNGADDGDVPIDPNDYEPGDPVIVLSPGTMTRTGHTFDTWNTAADGAGVPRDPYTQFTMSGDGADLYAQWTPNEYELTVVAADGGSITEPVDSPVTVLYGVPVPIAATPADHFHLDHWEVTAGSAAIADPYAVSTTVTVGAGGALVTAVFALDTYELSVQAATGGSITVPSSSPVTVEHGESLGISAEPADGYHFLEWIVTEGAATVSSAGSPSTSAVLEDGDATITATFELNTYVLTLSRSIGGTITEPADPHVTVNHGAATPITCVADEHFYFTTWYVRSGTATIADPSLPSTSVTLEDGDATLGAEFWLETYQLTVTAGAGGTITEPSSSPAEVGHGLGTAITATPSTGYHFHQWAVTSGAATIESVSSASTTVTLADGDATIAASFELNTYELSVTSAAGGSIIEPEESPLTVDHGAATAIAAAADSGAYVFDGWAVTSGSATIAGASDASTSVWLETGDATIEAQWRDRFPVMHTIASSVDGASSVYAIDVDGDGDMDVLSASADDNVIAWYENDGTQAFTAHPIASSAIGAAWVCAADLDGDTDIDVVSASAGDSTVAWYENDGSEAFTPHVLTTTADGACHVSTADIDGDTDLDILAVSRDDDTIAWYENNGSGVFVEHLVSTIAGWARAASANDIDGDGDVDLVCILFGSDRIIWYENDGAQDFTTTHTLSTWLRWPDSLLVIDLDDDDDVDFLYTCEEGGGAILWFENLGSGAFQIGSITYDPTGLPSSLHGADIDGDGDVDVVSPSLMGAPVAWYENDGEESFTTRLVVPAADTARAVFTQDVDGDGDIDILSASENDDTIAWHENMTIE